MATPFSHILQSLTVDNRQGIGFVLLSVSVLSMTWLCWLFYAQLGVYKTASAYLRAEKNIYSVESPAQGRVFASHMKLGLHVHKGDVLVELDRSTLRLKLAEQEAALASAHNQLLTVEAGIAAEQKALKLMQEASPVSHAESRLRYQQAEPAADLAEAELARWRNLREGGYASELQILDREAVAQRRRHETEELRIAMTRQVLDRRAIEADRLASIERLRREAAELRGMVAVSEELLDQTRYEMERNIIRAPADGPLADVADLRTGMTVKPGDRLATIVPSGELVMVADLPAMALGHVQPGQTAWMRVDGYAVEQYGRVKASVLRVANEPRAGKIRVELALDKLHTTIPLQHGLLGVVDILSGQISPFELLLQSAGASLRRAPNVAQP